MERIEVFVASGDPLDSAEAAREAIKRYLLERELVDEETKLVYSYVLVEGISLVNHEVTQDFANYVRVTVDKPAGMYEFVRTHESHESGDAELMHVIEVRNLRAA